MNTLCAFPTRNDEASAAVDQVLNRTLLTVWGYPVFRENQREAVRAILMGRDLIMIKQTSGGKSLCFQLPALLMEGCTVVIAPIISLMQDQVNNARARGIRAEFINSTQKKSEVNRIYHDLICVKVKLLYIAPERMEVRSFVQMMPQFNIRSFCVDESHCVAQWGAEFRPVYWRIAKIIADFHCPVSAFTATATPETELEIIHKLGMTNPVRLHSSFDRPNLWYNVVAKHRDGIEQICEIAASHPGLSGIVYRTTRNDVMYTTSRLEDAGIKALAYHAGLDAKLRKENQEAFQRGEVDVIVATIAFGMGIDMPGIRYIIHGDIPKNIEAYYQETGRAGRDGNPAACYFLFSDGDIPKTRWFIDATVDPQYREKCYKQFLDMVAYARTRGCRRQYLLNYFKEDHPGNCHKCDVCNK